jgi:hypothetical protein
MGECVDAFPASERTTLEREPRRTAYQLIAADDRASVSGFKPRTGRAVHACAGSQTIDMQRIVLPR